RRAEVFQGHALINDGYFRRIGSVVLIEIASGQNRSMERLEVVVGDLVEKDCPVSPRSCRVPIDHDINGASAIAHWQDIRRTGGVNARYCAQLFQHLAKLALALAGSVVAGPEVD